MDACCLIEGLKGNLGLSTQHDSTEVDMIQRVLRAGRNGDMDVFTSMVSVAEVLYVDEKPPSDDEKALIERFLMSGRDGIKLVSVTPSTSLSARDLSWENNVFGKSIDMVHLASAIQCRAKELLSLDGRLGKKLRVGEIKGCRLISPTETLLLPEEYRTDDLFNG